MDAFRGDGAGRPSILLQEGSYPKGRGLLYKEGVCMWKSKQQDESKRGAASAEAAALDRAHCKNTDHSRTLESISKGYAK